MLALIVANGALESVGCWQDRIVRADLIVAADGGSRHARALGLVPDVVVGDLDSLDEDTAGWLKVRGVPRVQYPPAKDETDLELALLYAAEVGAEQILVLGGWGGRPDQTIANLHLLAHPELSGRRVSLVGRGYEISLLRGGEEAEVHGSVGDTVSLLPLSDEAAGVDTAGLRWGLDGAVLRLGPARGVSNEMTDRVARVRLRQGLLLIVHLFSETAEASADRAIRG